MSFDPDHWYYDPDGNPITVQQWGTFYEDFDSRVLARDTVGDATLITVYLGYVAQDDPCARLFGSALIVGDGRPSPIDHYDSREEAMDGHAVHLAALHHPTPADLPSTCHCGRRVRVLWADFTANEGPRPVLLVCGWHPKRRCDFRQAIPPEKVTRT